MADQLASRGRGWAGVTAGLTVVLVVAGLLRFWRISSLPPGLYYDEAFNNLLALRISHGEGVLIYFPENNGEEPLHIYLIASLYHFVGNTHLGGRLVSAGLGVAAVLGQFLAAREIFHALGSRRADGLALLASLVLACWYWPIHISRVGMEMPTVPAVGLPAVFFTWRALRTGLPRHAALAGVFAGLSLYAYTAGRVTVIAVALILLYHLVADRGSRRQTVAVGIGAAVIGLVTFLPLGIFYLSNPLWLVVRTSQVAGPVVGGQAADPAAQLWRGVVRTVLGLMWHGDENWLHNLPGRPALDTVQFACAVVGLWVCARRWRERAYWFIPIWAALGLLPTVLTEFSPHFGRAIGAMPPLAMLVALGMYTVAGRVRAAWPGERGLVGAALVVGLAVAVSTGWAVRDYFVTWARSPDLFLAFFTGVWDIGLYANELPRDEPVYITPWAETLYPLRYAVGDDLERLRTYNGRVCLVVPSRTDSPAHEIVVFWPGEDMRSRDRLPEFFPQGREVFEWQNPTGPDTAEPYAVDFLIPAGAVARWPDGFTELPATGGGPVALRGYAVGAEVVRPGEDLDLTLLWEARSSLADDYALNVALMGPVEWTPSGVRVWAQHSARPCGKSYLTRDWQPGDWILEDYVLAVPRQAPPGKYWVAAGLARLAPGADAGELAALDVISVAHIDIEGGE